MQKTNTIIVGQGIAGSLVAHMLHLHKVNFLVIDPGLDNTSSRVAAGMFTPVTGKRKTIHPMVPVQLPFALETYEGIGRLLGVDILHRVNILEIAQSTEEQQVLKARKLSERYAGYLVDLPVEKTGFNQAGFEIAHSGWVDCQGWLESCASWLKSNNALIASVFNYSDLQISPGKMAYRGIEFHNIIFCEGYGAIDNPFFREQPVIPCKGDLLTIRYKGPGFNRIIKKNGIYVIPLGQQLYRAGSTYGWSNDQPIPDPDSRKIIENALDDILGRDYETVDHRSAVRPTTANREVIANQHPQLKGMYMLNGLGARGVLQGPWFARKIVELCLQNQRVGV